MKNFTVKLNAREIQFLQDRFCKNLGKAVREMVRDAIECETLGEAELREDFTENDNPTDEWPEAEIISE